jgi:hypothetical protein
MKSSLDIQWGSVEEGKRDPNNERYVLEFATKYSGVERQYCTVQKFEDDVSLQAVARFSIVEY